MKQDGHDQARAMRKEEAERRGNVMQNIRMQQFNVAMSKLCGSRD